MLIIMAILILGGLGFIFALLLALAADYFKVNADPRLASIVAILPGSNCGACGNAGCLNFAEKLIKGEVQVSGCLVGGVEVEKKLAAVMGVQSPSYLRLLATLHCGAKEEQRTRKAHYAGAKTCAAADLVENGGLACSYACLGYGDCFCVCPFAAIKMADGLPIIDPEKCTACGKCVDACPRRIISLRPYDRTVVIACSSFDRGAQVMKICPVGCIACRICEKMAPELYRIENNLARLDYSKETGPAVPAIEKCPTHCIIKLEH